jgi:hypothetical protein
MRILTTYFVASMYVLLPSPVAFAQTSESSTEKSRLQLSIAQAVSNSIAPHEATISVESVVIDPDPENNLLGMPDVYLRIVVTRQDCSAVEAMAKTIESVARVLSLDHEVKGIKFIAVSAVVSNHQQIMQIDRRDFTQENLLRLQKRGARTANYLSVGELAGLQTVPNRDDVVIAACVAMICAPAEAIHCTAKRKN